MIESRKQKFIQPFGPIFWSGFIIGSSLGCIVTTILWWLK